MTVMIGVSFSPYKLTDTDGGSGAGEELLTSPVQNRPHIPEEGLKNGLFDNREVVQRRDSLMADAPYISLRVADYMAETGHLSTLENGAYLLLLIFRHQNNSTIPSSDEQLSTIARMSPEEWRSVKPAISEFFKESNGLWIYTGRGVRK